MNISIFGMGYVGAVSAVCLAERGHQILGVDTNANKVDLINKGIPPIIEDELPELFQKVLEQGTLKATTNAHDGVMNTELSIICVGTPSNNNGSLDSKYLIAVSKEIAAALKVKTDKHVLVYRSTMLPGLLTETIIPLLEAHSGKKNGVDFFVCFNPEFLRESTSVYDFYNPPKTVVGADNEWAAEKVLEIYKGLPGPMIKTSLAVAEMVKYCDNTFHALKITYANEIGQICKSLGIDSHEVMDIFVQDTKLNISKAYLKPGFAFGGSCLPKDLRAMSYLAKTKDVEIPLLNSLLISNEKLISVAVKDIMSFGKRKIGFAGFSFKAGTDDLRESPIVEVIERLIGKGYDIKLYDHYVSVARLTGANKEYIEKAIPHISSVMVGSLEELKAHSELIIIGNKNKEFLPLAETLKSNQAIYDLARLFEKMPDMGNYKAIA